MSKYQFTPLSSDLDVIQKLDDLPNAVGGLSADQLKAKFDEAVNIVKAFLNSSLIAELESKTVDLAGAYKIGIEPVVGLTGVTNVQDAIVALLNAYTAGTVTDGSVTTVKLADNAVTAPKIKDGEVSTSKLAAGAVTGAKCDFSAGLTVPGDLNQQGKIILDSDCYGDTLPAAGTPGRIFFKKVQ